MAKLKKKDRESIQLNLTSMLDIVFQLIVFFLLITNFTSSELPDLDPPFADNAYTAKDRNYMTVNVIPKKNELGKIDGSGEAQYVRVGGKNIDPKDYKLLTEMLIIEREKDESIEIDLRADTTVHYQYVQPVMKAITMAKISRINLVAMTDEK